MEGAYFKSCGNICFTSLIQKQLRFYVRIEGGGNGKGKKEKKEADRLLLACRVHVGFV